MIKWKGLLKRIPHSITIKRNVKYEIVHTLEIKGNTNVLGETRFNEKQIVLKLGDTSKETVHTYLHEVLHAVSDAYDAGLTETQVASLEKAIYYILKSGNIFLEDK